MSEVDFGKLFYSTPLFSGVYVVWGPSEHSMRKSTVYLFVLLTLVSLSLALVPQVSSQPENIKVLSYSWYVDSIGLFDVVGEVQNVGPNTIESVVLGGIVYTMDGVAQTRSVPTYCLRELPNPPTKSRLLHGFPLAEQRHWRPELVVDWR